MARARLAALIAVGALLLSGSILSPVSQPAWAADYPSWNDVQGARNNEAAKAAQIVKLQGLLRELEASVEATQKVAEEKGQVFFEAQLEYDKAVFKADQLQVQADEAQAEAQVSVRKAGQLVARTQRVGGADFSAQLLFGDDSKDLLSHLGMANKVSQQSAGIYAKAKLDQNTAQSLTDQANVAKAALKGLADAAQAAMAEAQSAADAASAALQEQEEYQATLQAQLATLQTDREHTEAEYRKGVEAMWGAGAGAAGPISASGWSRPAAGYASESSFGLRVPPFGGASSWHMGTDIGAGCNTGIFAAHSGTVVYAGYNGGYGNFVMIDHGGGVTTSYGHIVNGGMLVHVGQSVGPGMPIARIGMTGTADGCHLHFEVRQGGTAVNPVSFLRNQGVNI